VRKMLRALASNADRLDRRFELWLRKRGCDAAQTKAVLAITPAAAARLESLTRFFRQVSYSGRRLAKLNLPPTLAIESLQEFDRLAGDQLQGRFAPAREQLQLATHFLLNRAYYEVREAEAQAFFGLYEAESQANDLNDLLSRIVHVLTKAFHAAAGRLLLEDQDLPQDLRSPLYIERGQPNQCLIADRRMRAGFASYWSYPFGPSAVLQLGFKARYPWLPRERTLLAAAAARCREAIERTRMSQQIRRLQAESLRTEEEERRRIGRDLHDEAGQALAFLRLQLEMIERDAPRELRPRLTEVRELAGRTTIELRRIISALSPSVLERLGLEAALRLLIKRFQFSHQISIRHRSGVLPVTLSRPAQEVIYRVVQECLQNVAKHSGADRVNVFLRCADKRIRLTVRDNGAGFNVDRGLSKPRSYGLAGMRERAMLLGGTLTLRTAPGEGTEVKLDLPAPVTAHGKNSRIVD
jgi:signal transduction histidine kinase